MNLKIRTLPDTQLRQKSTSVPKENLQDTSTQVFIDELVEAMKVYDGIGIAAPQVGHNIRMVVIDKDAFKRYTIIEGSINPKKSVVLVNPTWERISRKTNWDTEGCLSVPDTYGKVKRYTNIRLSALTREGSPLIMETSGTLARVIQHEVDHLDGVLFVDKAKNIFTHK
tara:strand:- start:50 stop:556 length:507 start_codon:yes stop_codon:yes gene_type:complete